MIAVIINLIEERVLNVNKIAQKFNNYDNFYVLFVCQFTNEKLKNLLIKKLPKNIYFLFSKKKITFIL